MITPRVWGGCHWLHALQICLSHAVWNGGVPWEGSKSRHRRGGLGPPDGNMQQSNERANHVLIHQAAACAIGQDGGWLPSFVGIVPRLIVEQQRPACCCIRKQTTSIAPFQLRGQLWPAPHGSARPLAPLADSSPNAVGKITRSPILPSYQRSTEDAYRKPRHSSP
ncbi:hypothetical protein GQ53DRAFT_34744 [Thozetella sp. PMI_491]|nr:hypothetical protein GQ53DRAFT_34744 [Thozetella sp. PMI_491]